MRSNALLPAALRAAVRAAVCGVPLSFGAGAAHAGDDDVRWDAQGAAARRAVVAPGQVVEWCSPLKRDERVRWRFEASAVLDFNVHYHAGQQVVFPERRNAVAAAGDLLQAPVDQAYCWMWTNRGTADVSLSASLAKAP
jgi:hypothetical protein